MSQNCSFHPEEESTGKCYRCSRYFCFLDKKTFVGIEDEHIKISENNKDKYKDFCKLCYADIQIQGLNDKSNLIFFMIVSTIMIVILLKSISYGENNIISRLLVLIFIIPIIVINFTKLREYRNSPSHIKKWYTYKEKFLKSLKKIPEGIEISIPSLEKPNNTKTFCMQCGGYIDLPNDFCPSCGEPNKLSPT